MYVRSLTVKKFYRRSIGAVESTALFSYCICSGSKQIFFKTAISSSGDSRTRLSALFNNASLTLLLTLGVCTEDCTTFGFFLTAFSLMSSTVFYEFTTSLRNCPSAFVWKTLTLPFWVVFIKPSCSAYIFSSWGSFGGLSLMNIGKPFFAFFSGPANIYDHKLPSFLQITETSP